MFSLKNDYLLHIFLKSNNKSEFEYKKITIIDEKDIYTQKRLYRNLYISPIGLTLILISGYKLYPMLLSKIKTSIGIEKLSLFKITNQYSSQSAVSHQQVYSKEILKEIKNKNQSNASTVEVYEEKESNATFTKKEPKAVKYSSYYNKSSEILPDSILKSSKFESAVDDLFNNSKTISYFKTNHQSQQGEDGKTNDYNGNVWERFVKRFIFVVIFIFPFSFILINSVFEYVYYNYGLYIKYQPFVDAYVGYLESRNKKI